LANAGEVKVGEVTDLQLATETNAVAHFAWELKPNKVGKILTSNNGDKGTGEVEFGKKPDGTWFVEKWALRPNILGL
jgi:predicted secreted protein